MACNPRDTCPPCEHDKHINWRCEVLAVLYRSTVMGHDGIQLLVWWRDRIMITNCHRPMCPPVHCQRRYSASARVLTLLHIIQRSSSGCCGLVRRALPPCLSSRDRRCIVKNEPLSVIIWNAHVVSQRKSGLVVTCPAYMHPSGAYLLRYARDRRQSCSNDCLFHARRLSIVYCKYAL